MRKIACEDFESIYDLEYKFSEIEVINIETILLEDGLRFFRVWYWEE